MIGNILNIHIFQLLVWFQFDLRPQNLKILALTVTPWWHCEWRHVRLIRHKWKPFREPKGNTYWNICVKYQSKWIKSTICIPFNVIHIEWPTYFFLSIYTILIKLCFITRKPLNWYQIFIIYRSAVNRNLTFLQTFCHILIIDNYF